MKRAIPDNTTQNEGVTMIEKFVDTFFTKSSPREAINTLKEEIKELSPGCSARILFYRLMVLGTSEYDGYTSQAERLACLSTFHVSRQFCAKDLTDELIGRAKTASIRAVFLAVKAIDSCLVEKNLNDLFLALGAATLPEVCARARLMVSRLCACTRHNFCMRGDYVTLIRVFHHCYLLADSADKLGLINATLALGHMFFGGVTVPGNPSMAVKYGERVIENAGSNEVLLGCGHQLLFLCYNFFSKPEGATVAMPSSWWLNYSLLDPMFHEMVLSATRGAHWPFIGTDILANHHLYMANSFGNKDALFYKAEKSGNRLLIADSAANGSTLAMMHIARNPEASLCGRIWCYNHLIGQRTVAFALEFGIFWLNTANNARMAVSYMNMSQEGRDYVNQNFKAK